MGNMVDSGLGWSCDEDYLVSATSQRLCTQSAEFYKLNEGPAVCAQFHGGGWYGPLAVSTVNDYAMVTPRNTTVYPVDVNGITWYICDFAYWNHSPDNPTVPVLDADYAPGAETRAQIVSDLLEAANVTLDPTGPYYTVAFNHDGSGSAVSYQKIPLGEETALNLNTFTKNGYRFRGWDTSPAGTTIVFADGQNVTDLAGDGETFNLYAVWDKTWAYLLGDGNGKFYTATKTEQEVDGETVTVQSLVELTGVEVLTAADFGNSGFQFAPSGVLLKSMNSPKIYKWDESIQPELKAKVSAIPLPQPIITRVDLSPAYIIGIRELSVEYDTSDGGTVTASYSYDNVTYAQDMSIGDFEALDLNMLYAGLHANKQLYFRFTISGNARLTSFNIKYSRRTFSI